MSVPPWPLPPHAEPSIRPEAGQAWTHPRLQPQPQLRPRPRPEFQLRRQFSMDLLSPSGTWTGAPSIGLAWHHGVGPEKWPTCSQQSAKSRSLAFAKNYESRTKRVSWLDSRPSPRCDASGHCRRSTLQHPRRRDCGQAGGLRS